MIKVLSVHIGLVDFYAVCSRFRELLEFILLNPNGLGRVRRPDLSLLSVGASQAVFAVFQRRLLLALLLEDSHQRLTSMGLLLFVLTWAMRIQITCSSLRYQERGVCLELLRCI